MQVRRGKNRIGLVLPRVGVVIKLPIIPIIEGIRVSLSALRRGSLGTKWCHRHLKRLLFEGIGDNWREFRFYKKTCHLFLQPSYLSLFGLLNIQRMGRPCTIKPVDLWCQLYELTQGAVSKDLHHFHNPANFCFQNEGLRILDYGSSRTQEVISEFGMKIMGGFDPDYSWEERKKQLRRERESSA